MGKAKLELALRENCCGAVATVRFLSLNEGVSCLYAMPWNEKKQLLMHLTGMVPKYKNYA